MVFGHTDKDGTHNYNYKLGANRARSVKEYLMKLGITENRIIISTLGEDSPKASNQTEEGKGMNRRVEVRLF